MSGQVAGDEIAVRIADDPIERIVDRNVGSGRYRRVCSFTEQTPSREEYARQVAHYHARHSDQVSRLERGDRPAWEELWRLLFRAAYGLLLRAGWAPAQAYARAEEATQECCLTIYCRSYPYDCPFDAWVLTILRHQVFRPHHRSRNPLDLLGRTCALEERDEQESAPDASRIEAREPLIEAVSRLPSEPQREVIMNLFFRDRTVEETAAMLGKTPQAIYNLKGRALARLAELLSEDDANRDLHPVKRS